MTNIVKTTIEPFTIIDRAIGHGIELAKKEGKHVEFDFNGINLIVSPNNTVKEVKTTWVRKMQSKKRAI